MPDTPKGDKGYLFPCETEGKCRQLLFQKHGFAWYDSYPKNGVVHVTTDSPMGFPVYRGNYKCCTQCHLPLNRAESEIANKLWGNTTADIPEPSEDFMRLLHGF